MITGSISGVSQRSHKVALIKETSVPLRKCKDPIRVAAHDGGFVVLRDGERL